MIVKYFIGLFFNALQQPPGWQAKVTEQAKPTPPSYRM
jgi:hypothetical protein